MKKTISAMLLAAAVGLSARRTVMRAIALASLVAAAAWLPVSIVLAGNLALNFSGSRGEAWWALSVAVVVGVLATLACALAVRLFSRYRRPI